MMKIKKIILTIASLICIFPTLSMAAGLGEILYKLGEVYGINVDIKNLNAEQINILTKGLTGTHNYGSLFYDANALDAGSNHTWQHLLALYQVKDDESPVAKIIQQTVEQFPISDTLGSVSPLQNKYYQLQAQTALASRATSELAFDQVTKEMDVLQKLHQEIDRAPDNKSAVDLGNRVALENTSINVEQAKLLALLVQQTAVAAQDKTNQTQAMADFFNHL